MPFRDATVNMILGAGVDALTGEVKSVAVTTDEIVPPPEGATGQDVFFRLDKIETLEEFQESLGLSIEGSASFGLFGGSEKFSLVERSRFNRFSVFLKAHVRVINPEKQLNAPRLLPEARDLIANGDTVRFRERFGDFFIRGILTGGEYFALLEIETTSELDQEEIKNDLEASGAFGVGFDVQSKFIKAVSNAASRRFFSIDEVQLGGADTEIPREVDKMVEKAARFAAQAKDVADLYQVDLAPYNILDLPSLPNPIDIQQRNDVLEQDSRLRSTFLRRLNEIDFILSNPDQFNPPGSDLNALREQVVEALNQIKDGASNCRNSVRECKFLAPQMPDFSVIPERLGPRARGPRVTVPDLIRLSTEDAQSQVESAGLRFASVLVFDPEHNKRVTGQDPLPFASVPPNSVVTVTVGFNGQIADGPLIT